MILFNLLLFLASFYGLMALSTERLSIPTPQAPFVTVVLLASMLYISALFGLLLWISWLVFIAGLVSAALFLRRHAQNISHEILIHRHSWYSAATFGVLFLAGRLITDGAYLAEWDEFSFWGIFPKILVYTNKLIADFDSINRAEAPRGTALLQYYFVLFLNGGVFRDDLAILAQVTLISSAVPAFLFSRDRCFRRPVISCFMLSLVVFVYYTIFGLFVKPIYSLLVDSAIALCWAMSIILYLMNKDTRNPMLASGAVLFFMVQLKEIALFFALTAIFVIAVEHALNSGLNIRRKAWSIGFLIAIVTASSVSWKFFLSLNGISGTFTVDMGALSNLEAYQLAIIENYLYSLIHLGDLPKQDWQLLVSEEADRVVSRFAYPIFGVSLSPIYWTILFIVFMLLFSLDKDLVAMLFVRKSTFYSFLFCLLLVTFGYVCLILFLYLTTIDPWPAIRLQSFSRYIGTQYLGLFLILTFLIAMMKRSLFTFFGFMMLFSPHAFLYMGSAMVDKNLGLYLENRYRQIDPVIEKIKERQPRGRVIFINQGGSGSGYVNFKYRAFPLSFPADGIFSLLPERKRNWSPETREISPDDFGMIIRDRKIDYLIVWNDGEFWESYGDVVRQSDLKGIWHLQDGELVAVNLDL